MEVYVGMWKYISGGHNLVTISSIHCNNLFSCGGQIRIISFIEDPYVIDIIISHLNLHFQTERPSPCCEFRQELLVAAEESWEYFWEWPGLSMVSFEDRAYPGLWEFVAWAYRIFFPVIEFIVLDMLLIFQDVSRWKFG